MSTGAVAAEAGSAPASSCSSCNGKQTLSITMSNGRGGPHLTMTSCPRCERRAWAYADGRAASGEVLSLLAGKDDFILSRSRQGARMRRR